MEPRFLGPTRVHSPHGISIGSPGFAGLRTVTDRQTDHSRPSRSVTIGHIYAVVQRGLINQSISVARSWLMTK